MKIETLYTDSRQISPAVRPGQEPAADFGKTLAAAMRGESGRSPAGASPRSEAAKAREAAEKAEKAAEAKRQAAQAAREAVRKELDDFLKKSPAEHMRDAILASMGLSEESLAAMPPEQRAAVEDEIARKIRERMLGKNEEPADDANAPQAAATEAVGGVAVGPSPEGMAQLTALRAALASGGGGLLEG